MNIRDIIRNLQITPFGNPLPKKSQPLLKTKDAKKIHEKLRKKLCSSFVFSSTKNILDAISLPCTPEEVKKRQAFFSGVDPDNSYLEKLSEPRPFWRPSYSIVVVTEDEKTYSELKSMKVPVTLLLSSHDLEDLRDYDIVQAIACDNFRLYLEELENVVFFENYDDIYLERYLRHLSGWKNNIEILQEYIDVSELKALLNLLNEESIDISSEDAENSLDIINSRISNKLKDTSIAGNELFNMLDSGSLPEPIQKIVTYEINHSGLPPEIFIQSVPVKIDYEELENIINKKTKNIYTDFAERLKKKSDLLHSIPELLRGLEIELLCRDFCSIMKSCQGDFPEVGELKLANCLNPMLNKPEPVSFHLDKNNRCSILTGANSGGKTTLIEHIIQIIILGQMGLPVEGNARVPCVKEIFYFAKNKGSMNQGAFETLLNQMASIKSAENPIIFADEIEAITEPGVAADIISATAEFYLNKGFYLIFATHLGKEIQGRLPEMARIDGIEAEGLDDNFNLILKRSPVLGKLAHSTPELIIERLSQKKKDEYFRHLENYIKKF
ncbi:MAG: hypothetical protein ACQESF_06055 [Nanobdellota archaeon]